MANNKATLSFSENPQTFSNSDYEIGRKLLKKNVYESENVTTIRELLS
jgi:hypothetical protein